MRHIHMATLPLIPITQMPPASKAFFSVAGILALSYNRKDPAPTTRRPSHHPPLAPPAPLFSAASSPPVQNLRSPTRLPSRRYLSGHQRLDLLHGNAAPAASQAPVTHRAPLSPTQGSHFVHHVIRSFASLLHYGIGSPGRTRSFPHSGPEDTTNTLQLPSRSAGRLSAHLEE